MKGPGPDHLPMLSRGGHRRSEDGACVMEYVSVLSGGRFSDHPRCTHPALASLARLVNDRIIDDGVRGELALLAPDLIGAGRGDRLTTPRVVVGCLRAAAAAGSLPAAAARRLARASVRMQLLDRGVDRWTRVRLRCWQLLNPSCVAVGSAFQVAVEQIRVLPPRERDVRLSQLLQGAVADCRRTVEAPAPDRPSWATGARHRVAR